ncbi:MAG: hypothetical protein CV088_15535 [Nitrospira sp. LK70]|nr:hypothetical protein [Nitrospira sp. LK70]
MSSRHRLEKKLSQEIDEVDIKGIAVALAFLVIVGVFAGGRDSHSVSGDRQSLSASVQSAPAVTMEKTETLQQPDDDPDLSGTSHGLKTFR